MKTNTSPRVSLKDGVTTIELVVIIAVLMTLATILMAGARAWCRGADRAACVVNIRNVQTSVRSYQNMYGYNPGTMPYAENGTQSIADHLYRKGYINEKLHTSIKGADTCPGGGDYAIAEEDRFPSVGDLYVACSLEGSRKHLLSGEREW